MPRYRLARSARTDIARILAASAEQRSIESRRRYAALLSAAMRKAVTDSQGPPTRDRSDISSGLRSLHLRHARGKGLGARVRRPIHVLYYRTVELDLIEIVRVLHERMEPSRNLHLERFDESED
jgi:toxin ParE1/3/4